MKQLYVGLTLLLFGGCARHVSEPVGPGPVARALKAVEARATEGRQRQRSTWLRRFYAARQYQPAWIVGGNAHARVDELLAQVRDAQVHGLEPEHYGSSALQALVSALRQGKPVPSAALDVALSAAFVSLADDLQRGAIDPTETIDSWHVPVSEVDLSGLLATAIDLHQVGATLRRLAPSHGGYRRLQQALQEEPAERHPTLRANMERWRWLPRDLGSRYILVRIADFEVDAVIDGQVRTYRAIVGEPYRQTPQFASTATHIVVHPSWHVPSRIADEELAPALRSDPAAFAASGFDILTHAGESIPADQVSWKGDFSSSYRLVQQPGPGNPLGRLKLDMMNPFAVFLHDTPYAGLFDRVQRDLSHGCVRVEGFADLVEGLLQSAPSLRRQLRQQLQAGQSGRIRLPAPVPVYLLYWTAGPTPAGDIRYAPDPYGIDSPVLRALGKVSGATPWVVALPGQSA